MLTIVCPYCFARMRSRALQFRCLQSPSGTRSGQACPAEPDEKLTAFLGRATPVLIGPVFYADGSRSQAACPVCDVVTTKRVCPECHNDLPGGYDSIGGRIIALVGPKTSGKSTYVTVLIRELRERVGEYFGAAVNAMDDRTAARYETAHAELFKEGHLPPMTPPSSLDLTYPQLYKVTIPRRGMLGSRSLSSALVFFDTAGEDLESAESTARNVSYLAQADRDHLDGRPAPVRDRTRCPERLRGQHAQARNSARPGSSRSSASSSATARDGRETSLSPPRWPSR